MTTKTAPQHGQRACYLRGCRLPECADANRRFCKQYRLDRLQHGPRRVDAEPARHIVTQYITAGWSYSAIAGLAQCSETVITDLIQGAPRINPVSAQRISAIPPTPRGIRGCAYTDATGTIRRGRALACIGYLDATIAAALPMHPDALTRTLNRDSGLVLATTAHAMTTLYAQWRLKPGPSIRARRRAENRGWHGPLAWDGNIDDPDAQPDTDNPPDPDFKRGERAEQRREEIWLLHTACLTDGEISRRVGLAISTVRDIRAELRTGKKRNRKQAAA